MTLYPFHLAIPVDDLAASEAFYGDVLGCAQGRRSAHWIDWNFFGHQLVTHMVEKMPAPPPGNEVDSKTVPVPHFGVVLSWHDWESLAARLEAVNTDFIIAPYVRFKGEVGEQATLFFQDPCGNALEFKAFKNIAQLFAN